MLRMRHPTLARNVMAVVHLKRWNLSLGTGQPLFVIAGLNVLESLELALTVGKHLKETAGALGLPYVFKASFDKANRSSIKSYRGPGLKAGLAMLAEVKRALFVFLQENRKGELKAPKAIGTLMPYGNIVKQPIKFAETFLEDSE